MLAISLDAFYHNHKYHNDCAHSLHKIDIAATAKVIRKTCTNKQFTEDFFIFYSINVVSLINKEPRSFTCNYDETS